VRLLEPIFWHRRLRLGDADAVADGLCFREAEQVDVPIGRLVESTHDRGAIVVAIVGLAHLRQPEA
jgi:hypothetical protein